jgi:hypothetical protein
MEVFFTIEQSTVLGTNLVTGPYSGTNMANLGRVLAKSQIEGDYKVADFEMYRPALGSPKAFIGTPIFEGPRVIAVMILRIPNDQIARILSGDESWEAEGWGRAVKFICWVRTRRCEPIPDFLSKIERLSFNRCGDRR